MKVYKVKSGILVNSGEAFYLLRDEHWDRFINDDALSEKLHSVTTTAPKITDPENHLGDELLAPIGQQEVWASGVTYYNSKLGREEESKDAGGSNFYARVYEAERPELFFKATAARTVGPGAKVRIRADSSWDVPEPELTLLITSSGKIVGYTIGNDMSSRSIEGENPLYLPQAKTYDGCAALGPCILVTDAPLPRETKIHLEIRRGSAVAFTGSIGIDQIKRKFDALAGYLYRECSFPYGSFLMTGTGIVPTSGFTLMPGDEVRITIDGIGTLVNWVA
jgi:2-dehydro-3-deoxy-D-arabinonate dehydratase